MQIEDRIEKPVVFVSDVLSVNGAQGNMALNIALKEIFAPNMASEQIWRPLYRWRAIGNIIV